MKCDMCGKEEVNYYYSSNINGKVTEKHLCAECAKKFENSGEKRDVFSEMESMMDGFFARDPFESFFGADPFEGFFSRHRLNPGRAFGFMLPAMIVPMFSDREQKSECGCEECRQETAEQKAPETDEKLSRRREINALRHQMKMAARNEDYEKAAELRDKLHELEKGE